ncbi:MAG TPA: Wzz/FepE/Etk N-terminal domain-containing protein [Terracidiphilus sp.]|nr:Wzz/FepE/Etk N-terminal domain-containing protein [Terracidiphilus sp.]
MTVPNNVTVAVNEASESDDPVYGDSARTVLKPPLARLDRIPGEFDGEDAEGLPMYFHLERLFRKMGVLWRARMLIAGATLPATIAIFAALYLIPNRYTAMAVLNPPDLNPISGLSLLGAMKGGMGSGLSSQMGTVLGLSTQGQEYVRMMQTRRIQDMLIQQFGLQKVYGTARMDQTRKKLASASTFSVDRKSNVIEISVTDLDPNRAAQLANGYASALGTTSATLSADSARQERGYFENQLTEAESELQSATDQLSQYGRKNAALDVDSGAKGIADAIGLLQGQIIASEAELKGMRAVYAEDNDRVKAMEAQISELKRQMAALGGPASTPAQSGDGSGGPSLAHLWSTAPVYLDLYGQVKLKAAIVDTLAQQYEFAKLQEAHRVSEIQLLDPALPPVKKSGPHRALIAVASGVFIFCLLCGWVLAKDWWINASPDDPWRLLLAPRIATLAVFTGRRHLR